MIIYFLYTATQKYRTESPDSLRKNWAATFMIIFIGHILYIFFDVFRLDSKLDYLFNYFSNSTFHARRLKVKRNLRIFPVIFDHFETKKKKNLFDRFLFYF